MIPHLLRYKRLAVDDYGFALDALDLGGHPRLSINLGFTSIIFQQYYASERHEQERRHRVLQLLYG